MLSFFRKKQSDTDLIPKGAIRSVFVEPNVSLLTTIKFLLLRTLLLFIYILI